MRANAVERNVSKGDWLSTSQESVGRPSPVMSPDERLRACCDTLAAGHFLAGQRRKAFQILSGVTGMSIASTPAGRKASSTAAITV